MLRELEIQQLGPIAHAIVNPAAGMSAITGETGAGKSMLLSALRLVSGDHVDSSRVAPGATRAWAQAIFDVSDDREISEQLQERGIEPEEGELYVSRVLPSKGRSRAVMNGQTVPKSVLSDVVGHLVTIHGQSDQLRLANTNEQRKLVDSLIGDTQVVDRWQQAWKTYQEICVQLEKATSTQAEQRARADYLRDAIARIEEVNPVKGEMDELVAQRDHIEHAAVLQQSVAGALQSLDSTMLENSDGDMESGSVQERISQAVNALQSSHLDSVLAPYISRLQAVEEECSDIAFSLSHLIDDEIGERDLDMLNERIHDLHELTERFGPTLDDVLAWLDQARLDVEDLDASPEKIEALRQAQKQAYQEAVVAAQALHHARLDVANAVSKQVSGELANLAMPHASFEIEIREQRDATGTVELSGHGMDTVEFYFSPFAGSGKLSMAASASGGELSRLMLALELVSAHMRKDTLGQRPTFIFDEVDAGVGGATAAELGKRLAQLAQSAQVLVVTHLPQVASWADAQYVVTKQQDEESAATTVREVRGKEREGEIARMLSGSITPTSLEHAQELLSQSTLR